MNQVGKPQARQCLGRGGDERGDGQHSSLQSCFPFQVFSASLLQFIQVQGEK